MKAEYLGHFGDDLMVVNAARVSFGKRKDVFDEKDEKLIHYLAAHGHKSPFFHPHVQFYVKVPIFVANQLKRHQVGLAINEVSRRYVDTEPEFFIPSQFRSRALDKKQGSGTPISPEKNEIVGNSICCFHDLALKHYMYLMEEYDIAPEQARTILPLNLYTEFIWTGSLYAWANMCLLRLKEDTQKETRDIVELISHAMRRLFPVSWEALCKHSRQAEEPQQ